MSEQDDRFAMALRALDRPDEWKARACAGYSTRECGEEFGVERMVELDRNGRQFITPFMARGWSFGFRWRELWQAIQDPCRCGECARLGWPCEQCELFEQVLGG